MSEVPQQRLADSAHARDAAHARADAARAHYAPAEARALGTLAVLATLAILWVIVPVGIGVLLGTLLAFTAYGPFRRLARRTGKPVLVALGSTFAAILLVTGALGIFGYVLVAQGVAVASKLRQSFGPGEAATTWIEHWGAPLALLKLDPSTLVDRLRGALGSVATSLASLAAEFVGALLDGALTLLFTAFTMFFVLLHWAELAKRAERLLPLNPHHSRHLLRQVRRLGRIVLVGNFGTALVQGAVAGVGYWIGRVPNAALLGGVTAVASLLPVVGTPIVWVPIALVLIARGHVAGGVFELIWGTVAVIGVCDYVVRPKLIGRAEAMSTWLTFVGLFGGIKLFGAIGLLLGPLMVGIAVASLRLYERARRFRLGLS